MAQLPSDREDNLKKGKSEKYKFLLDERLGFIQNCLSGLEQKAMDSNKGTIITGKSDSVIERAVSTKHEYTGASVTLYSKNQLTGEFGAAVFTIDYSNSIDYTISRIMSAKEELNAKVGNPINEKGDEACVSIQPPRGDISVGKKLISELVSNFKNIRVAYLGNILKKDKTLEEMYALS
jgi:hypothetical protein